MTPEATTLDITADLEAIATWWNTSNARDPLFHVRHFPIAGTPHDQTVPDGIHNPYWEIIRRLPSENSGMGDGITPYSYPRGLDGLTRRDLVTRFSWAIPSPGDLTWLHRTLNGRSMVEIGAGAGYWAWQAEQHGIDTIAYDPTDPADNTFTGNTQWADVRRGGPETIANHHDRALFLCWPSLGEPWARQTLTAYQGDLLIYVGEHWACCADDAFFEQLGAEWDEIEESPHHRTWWGIHCRMTAYRRSAS